MKHNVPLRGFLGVAAGLFGLTLALSNLLAPWATAPISDPIAGPIAEADRVCGDFAAAWDEKPEQMHFVGCEKIAPAPGEGLRATYLVSGSDAVGVEEFLQQEFGMDAMVFVCCYFGTDGPRRAQYYIDETDTFVSIGMYSEEAVREGPAGAASVILDRNKLQFYVYVEKVWGI